MTQAHQMTKVAKDSGVQRETLYRSLSEQGNPTLQTLTLVLGAWCDGAEDEGGGGGCRFGCCIWGGCGGIAWEEAGRGAGGGVDRVGFLEDDGVG